MDRADLGQQLTELLGRRGPHNIRKTDENPPRASVIDVVVVLTGQTANVAAIMISRLKEQHPEVAALSCDFKVPGGANKKRNEKGPAKTVEATICVYFLFFYLLLRFAGGGHHASARSMCCQGAASRS